MNQFIIFLGPGRSGTTSLYYSAKQSGKYHLSVDKEAELLLVPEFIVGAATSGLPFIDLSPTNLLNFNEVFTNTDGYLRTFFLINRNVNERMQSLYSHHMKLGTINETYSEYLIKSEEIYNEYGANPDVKKYDLTYMGLAEYHPETLSPLIGKDIKVVDFDSLYLDVNSVLSSIGLPELTPLHSNQSFIPRSRVLLKILLLVYKFMPFKSSNFSIKLRSLAKKVLSSPAYNFKLDSQAERILERCEKQWHQLILDLTS